MNKLSKQYKKDVSSIDSIINANYEALVMVDEIGDRIARSIVSYFQEEENISLINELKRFNLQFTYLKNIVKLVRQKNALCIADEIQTGFGRVGNNFWAFEEHGIVPDIVTLGKPMGNGHPIAAVVTTTKIANP